MTRSVYVKATEVAEGDNLYLSWDTGTRVARIEQVKGWVEIHNEVGLLRRVRPNAEVRLHGRGIPA